MKDYFELFQEVSEYHRQLNVLPVWERYGNGKKPWQSLAIFLSTYAYQTSGVNPNYAPVAEDTIRENAGLFDEGIADNPRLEDRIWSIFKEKMNGYGGLKHKGNPLSPYSSKEAEQTKDKDGGSLIARMQKEKIKNLIDYGKGCLDKDIVPEAHGFLDSIRGIGPKIASFFLRDIGDRFGCKQKDRELLQPIDVWIRRVVQRISPTRTFQNDEEIARWIVDEAKRANCNPERINMGMWYLPANICERSPYKFDKIFKSFESTEEAWEEYRERMRRICSIK